MIKEKQINILVYQYYADFLLSYNIRLVDKYYFTIKGEDKREIYNYFYKKL